MKLSKTFYLQENTLEIARCLIGKTLCSNLNGMFCSAMIVETEAYLGIQDKASHAFGNRQTRRTATMYLNGGIAYVYLIYGLHTMLNIVTQKAGIPHAILLRAAHPMQGLQHMQWRRGGSIRPHQLLRGPGSLARGMGIELEHNAIDLNSNMLWLETPSTTELGALAVTPRIGVDYAGADAALPYRYILHRHPSVSGSRQQNCPVRILDSSD